MISNHRPERKNDQDDYLLRYIYTDYSPVLSPLGHEIASEPIINDKRLTHRENYFLLSTVEQKKYTILLTIIINT